MNPICGPGKASSLGKNSFREKISREERRTDIDDPKDREWLDEDIEVDRAFSEQDPCRDQRIPRSEEQDIESENNLHKYFHVANTHLFTAEENVHLSFSLLCVRPDLMFDPNCVQRFEMIESIDPDLLSIFILLNSSLIVRMRRNTQPQ